MTKPPRRVVILVAGVLSAALVAGGAVAMIGDGEAKGDRVEALPQSPVELATETPEEPSPTPSETPSPTPSPKPKPPTAAATTTAPREPEATTTAPTTATTTAPDEPRDEIYTAYGPRSPGSLVFPYQPGQRSWVGSAKGVSVHVTLSPGARAGYPMRWTVKTASSTKAKCCDVQMWLGDGQGVGDSTCGRSSDSLDVEHVYNRGGKHHFMLNVGFCEPEGAAFYGSFDLGDGPSTAQGPKLPTVKFDRTTPRKNHQNDPHYVTLWGEAEDVDGYIAKMIVTFGDGTSKTFPGWSEPCEEVGDGWPNATYGMLPYEPAYEHHYTKPGTYTLTLTAYSTGCDGTQTQTGKASFTWTVPAPETPEPTPTPS